MPTTPHAHEPDSAPEQTAWLIATTDGTDGTDAEEILRRVLAGETPSTFGMLELVTIHPAEARD